MSVKVFPSLSYSLGSNGRGWAKPKDTVQSHTTAQVHSSSMQRLGPQENNVSRVICSQTLHEALVCAGFGRPLQKP